MIKKIVSLCLVLAIAVSLGASTYAFTADGTKLNERQVAVQAKQERIEELQNKNAKKQEALSERTAESVSFRQALIEDRLALLQNRENNLSLSSQSCDLRLAVLNSLEAIQNSGAGLPEDIRTKLEAYNAQILTLTAALKGTSGQIRNIVDEAKGLVKERDTEALDAAYAGIGTIQAARYNLILQINALLTDMNELLSDYTEGNIETSGAATV